MSLNRRETIHISLGSTSNAISSHLLNLQGLAATKATTTTTSDSSSNSTCDCDPYVTHTIQQDMYVPRVLFIDEPRQFQYTPTLLHTTKTALLYQTQTSAASSSPPQQPQPSQIPTWNGNVNYMESYYDNTNHPPNHNDMVLQQQQQQQQQHQKFHQAASTLAYSNYSRYRITNNNNNNATTTTSSYSRTLTSHTANQRHMQWDDDDDEEDDNEDDEDEWQYRQQRQYRQQQHWEGTTKIPLEQEMEHYWKSQLNHHPDTETDTATTTTATTTTATTNGGHGTSTTATSQLPSLLRWRDYWMPPYPSYSSYAIPLPFTNPLHGGIVDTFDTYMNGWMTTSSSSSSSSSIKPWIRDEVLEDKLRHVLESCDALQGVHIVTQGYGLYTGLTTSLLEELQEESRSAGRLVTHVIENNYQDDNGEDEDKNDTTEEQQHDTTTTTSSSSLSTTRMIEEQRQRLQSGLTLHGLATNAHVVLPLSIQNLSHNNNNNHHRKLSLFESSSKIAMALETATLPYRLSGSSSSSSNGSGGDDNNNNNNNIGLQGYFDGKGRSSWKDSFGMIDHLNFSEFMAYLKPSNQHVFVEMDMYSQHEQYQPPPEATTTTTTTPATTATLLLQTLSMTSMIQPQQQSLSNTTRPTIYQRLRTGTSIEQQQLLQGGRQQQQKQRYGSGGRPRDVLPGAWMLPTGISATDGGGEGIMSCLSPQQQPQPQQGEEEQLTTTNKMMDRQYHRHFSLASSFRPGTTHNHTTTSNSSSKNKNKDTLTFFMEGMGIRYHPEVSMGTTVNQSISMLTQDGYGVGSYWKHLLKAPKNKKNPVSNNNNNHNKDTTHVENSTTTSVPVLSVMGNSTRSYSYLNSVASNMKESLSRKYRGLHNRDVLGNILPEAEDCSEALEYCLDVRDAYHPPEGSGLVMDSEGYYFDGNMD